MGGFWQDVDDVGAVLKMLRGEYRLEPVCMIGHSAGAQLMLQYAARTATAAAPPLRSQQRQQEDGLMACPTLLINVHARFDLNYWYAEYKRQVAEKGEWVLGWKSNGREFVHAVTADDASSYSAVDMAVAVTNLPSPRSIARIPPATASIAGAGAVSTSAAVSATEVCSIYGFVAADDLAKSAGYNTRAVPTSDGVVPLADVAQIGNAIQDGVNRNKHTLVLLPGCSHYYREPGSKELLEHAIVDWLTGQSVKNDCHDTTRSSSLAAWSRRQPSAHTLADLRFIDDVAHSPRPPWPSGMHSRKQVGCRVRSEAAAAAAAAAAGGGGGCGRE